MEQTAEELDRETSEAAARATRSPLDKQIEASNRPGTQYAKDIVMERTADLRILGDVPIDFHPDAFTDNTVPDNAARDTLKYMADAWALLNQAGRDTDNVSTDEWMRNVMSVAQKVGAKLDRTEVSCPPITRPHTS